MKKLLGPFRSLSKSAERERSKQENNDEVVESRHKPILRSNAHKKRRNIRDDEKSVDSLAGDSKSGSWASSDGNGGRNATSLIDHSPKKERSKSMLNPPRVCIKIIKKSKTPPGDCKSIAEDVHRHLYTALASVITAKLPPTSPTAVGSSDMGNRPSNQSEEEEEKRPSRSCSGDLGLVDHNGSEDVDDEVEVPPPMPPISEQLLAATASAMGDESQAKRSASMPLKSNEGSTTAELATELEQIVRERMEQHENVDRLSELTLDSRLCDTTSSSGGAASSSLFGMTSNKDEEANKTGNGILLTGESSSAGGGAGGSAEPEDESIAALRKREYVIRELVDTERDYVRDLKEVIDGYMAIMRDLNSEIPMPDDLRGGRDKIIFGNIEAIYEWHRDIFSKALDKCIHSPEDLGPLFKKYERKLYMYVVYCQNKPMSEFIVSEYIDSYFEEIRQKLGHKLTLCDLLIKPVQRIMKYQLLLKDILKYTERIGIQTDIDMLKQATHVMHVVPKDANDMMNVGRLQGFDGKITSQGKLLLFGPLICSEGSSAVNFKGKELQVFFFEQSIILSEAVGKKTQFSNPVYIYKAHIQVNKMSLTESVDDGDPCKFTLRSTDPRKPSQSFVCQAASKESRDDWIAQLQLILQTQKDFLKAIQSPIKYQKNKLTKEVSAPDLWNSNSTEKSWSTSPMRSPRSNLDKAHAFRSSHANNAHAHFSSSASAETSLLPNPNNGTPASNNNSPTNMTRNSNHSHNHQQSDEQQTQQTVESQGQQKLMLPPLPPPPPPPALPLTLNSPNEYLIHPPHQHHPNGYIQNGSKPKKYSLNGWRTSLRSKTRTNNGRYATTIGTTGLPINENGSVAEWGTLSRRWSECTTAHKLNELPEGSNGTKTIPIPPGSVVRVIADFQAIKDEEVTVAKGDSVQILGVDQNRGYYFIRKMNCLNDDGWLPAHVLQTYTSNNNMNNSCKGSPTNGSHIAQDQYVGKKPFRLRFRKPSFNRKTNIMFNSTEDVMDLFDECAPVFCHEVKSVKCVSGDAITLQCQLCVNKFEPTVVLWKDAFGQNIKESSRHHAIYNEYDGVCTLTITDARVSDSGRYACIATNDAGSSTTSGVLSVTAVPPTRPSAPLISCVDSESVELNWLAAEEGLLPKTNIVKFYTVQHCIAESEMWTSCAVVADGTAKVQHLTPGQMYSFRIIAHGEGSMRSEPSLASESVIIPPNSPLSPKTPTLSSAPNSQFTANLHGSNGNGSIANGNVAGDTIKDNEFHKKYVELEDIDRGRFSVIRKCQDIATGAELAVKFVHRKRWKKQLILKEFQILAAIKHPSVVRGNAFCETISYSAIVMEYVHGASLFSYLCEQDFYMEYTVATLMQQLFQALEHIHSLEIAHLDIEPTNIMIDKSVLPPVLKIVDFGDACHVAEGSPDCLPQTLPSFEFASPEVLLRQKCSVLSDMWSVGVLIYLLLSGTFPFLHESFEKMSANIINGHYRFGGLDTFKGISFEAKELIKQLLLTTPSERLSASQCNQSVWIRQARKFVTPLPKTRLQPYINSRTIENGLRRFTPKT